MPAIRPPVISVVMPAYNAAGTLPAAVGSICAQTWADWELIVVDDGSTDDTTEILATLARTEPRLVLVRQSHRGIVSALHAGLERARGRFVARMDADDLSHPDRLGEQVNYLDRHPEIGLVSCLVEFGGDARASEGFARHVAWLNSVDTLDAIALNRFVESPVAHPSVMFRREFLLAHGSYCDGPFPEDYELWLRWLERGVQFAKVSRRLLTWRDSPTRLTRSDPRYALAALYELKAPFLARAIKAALKEREVWVWGAGRVTRGRAQLLAKEGLAVRGFIDVDPKKWGRHRDGRIVVGPEAVPDPERALIVVLVAKRGARELIRAHLQSRRYVEGRDFWMAA